MMGIALIMTGSRGGMISLVAEVVFLIAFARFKRNDEFRAGPKREFISQVRLLCFKERFCLLEAVCVCVRW